MACLHDNRPATDKCCICLQEMEENETKALHCGHEFHKICIDKYFEHETDWDIYEKSCPLCKAGCCLRMILLQRFPYYQFLSFYIIFISDCQCHTLDVSLSDGALVNQKSKQDRYEIFEIINGKWSWKSATHQVIWYFPQAKSWNIGPFSSRGTGRAGIQSIAHTEYDSPQHVPMDKWEYLDKSSKYITSSHAITVKCLDEGKKH